MSPRDCLTRIEDIRNAILATQDYTNGMSFEDFTNDRKTLDAVLHNIAVIGEAANHVPDDMMSRHNGIPWDKMRAIRNLIIHAYFGVRPDILWQTLKEDLPPLLPLLNNILQENR